MANFLEDHIVSSSFSSPTRTQHPQDFTAYGRFLSSPRGITTHAYGNRNTTNCSPDSRRVHWNVATDDRITSARQKDDIPAFNPTGLDLVLLCMVKCHACDFDIKVSLRCGRSQEFDASNMICPVCDEKLEEDVIRTVKNSSFTITHSSALNMGKKPALRGNKHDRMFGSALYEHDMTNAPDVTAAKSLGGADAPNTGGNEQDVEERSSRAAYFQDLFMSALFSE
ncbi:unnamed protein product [Lathyrus oleraceus]|uniref:Uncharacterized protein n=1 Tax=Pisum sativum TaxID=3888 RepID=A0A9D4WSQ8_PEA|nr:uncharacterized protein LOC127083720 [Pisum sativum]KAI5407202.1 hypothetical protein KIW84_053450 [Pisum sativum]